ncbi:hypothetical protein GCM10022380_18740 [Amycolatopsis tucumanensis]|uniref:Secreted protein n=1 Tax=Amycolatopsis tucumanensis TaxID=401106 RepID=A0ABP7HQ11_9PSEU
MTTATAAAMAVFLPDHFGAGGCGSPHAAAGASVVVGSVLIVSLSRSVAAGSAPATPQVRRPGCAEAVCEVGGPCARPPLTGNTQTGHREDPPERPKMGP